MKRRLLKAGEIFALFTLLTCVLSASSGGFLFAAPKRFLAGTNETVCIAFSNSTSLSSLQLTLFEHNGTDVLATKTEQLPAEPFGGKCFMMELPRTIKAQTGRLQLTLHQATGKGGQEAVETDATDGDYRINFSKSVVIQSHPDITFIQTDKPIYNGGDLVRFRMFTVRPDLRPVLDRVEKIWIENPDGIHVSEWINVSTEHGFIDRTFLLSSDPYIGTWNIRVRRRFDDEVSSASFEVKNHMWPRFSVSLDVPKWTTTTSEVNVTACARYTFGQPVQGELILQSSVECAFSYYCQANATYLKERFPLNSRGCFAHKVRLINVSNFAQVLLVNATIREHGTETTVTASARVQLKSVSKANFQHVKIKTSRTRFKPGLPLVGQILHSSDSVKTVLVCLEVNTLRHCQKLLLEAESIPFVISPQVVEKAKKKLRVFIEVTEKDKNATVPLSRLALAPWYSPSNSYLQIESIQYLPLKCGRPAEITVSYAIEGDILTKQFHYLVKSRGNIIEDGVIAPSSPEDSKSYYVAENVLILGSNNFGSVRQFRFLLNVSEQMSPTSHLLLFYIRSDGEVVADTLALQVEKCFENQVKTKWRNENERPGTIGKLELQANPNSVCALTIVDHSTKLASLLSSEKDLFFKAMEELEMPARGFQLESERCKGEIDVTGSREPEPLYEFPGMDSEFIDSLQAFDDFGAIVMSDLTIETRPCRDSKEELRNITSRHSTGQYNKYEVENMSVSEAAHRSSDRPSLNLRSFFPETWIWDVVSIGHTGRKDLNLTLPHTLTSWKTDTICLSAEGGLGIGKTTTLKTFQPFSLDFFPPRYVKRKEVFHLKVLVFNYMAYDFPVKIAATHTENFGFKSASSQSYCVSSNSKVVHTFVLEAIKLGEAALKVSAAVDSLFPQTCGSNVPLYLSDVVEKKTKVIYEGSPTEETKSGFICGGDSHYFESSIFWDMKFPADIVESSASSAALVSGDVLGPLLENTDKLISLPTGCGEQNMIQLVPNLLLLDYLLLTKAENLELVEKALKNLDAGYQRQLNYRRNDGSYSAFGEQDEEGSIWLTAFVLRYFSQAQKYIHVDKNDLKTTVKWIVKSQLENGCFAAVGKTYHRDLKGEVQDDESSRTLTAYILTSLIESGIFSPASPVVKNGIYCLRATNESLGLYGDLLTTYSLLLAGEVRDAKTIMRNLLEDATRTYNMLWWEGSSTESSIEMTSYGIMSLVKLGGPHFLAVAADAVRWITQYRNKNGGFFSTQDTILALEAISKFSTALPRIHEDDTLVIRVESTASMHQFNISNKNRLLQQEFKIPTYLPNIRFEASGKGCALVQTLLRYNVRRGTPSDKLKIQLKTDKVSLVNTHTIRRFHICVRYKSAKEKISMAVLEVFMVSGFYPDRSSLYSIPKSRLGIRRWEEYEDKVNFYFEDLRNKKVCIQFLVNQEVCVENPGPALIKLYDYYNINHLSTMRYSLESTCNSTQLWLDAGQSEVKVETKRETSINHSDIVKQNEEAINTENIMDALVDVDFDLEVPQGGDGVMPVYSLPPSSVNAGASCPHCLSQPPSIFSKMYCSSQAAVIVIVRSKEKLDFTLDITPRKNISALRRSVSVTLKKECSCHILNAVNSNALLMVTPPRSIHVHFLQELHLDDSVQLYLIENGGHMPQYIIDAMDYCQLWHSN